MFGWIDRAWQSVTGRISNDISSWVHDLVRGLYSFLAAIFAPVGAAWSYLWNNVINYHDWIGKLGDETYRALRDAYDWINREGYELYYYLTHPDKFVERIFDPLLAKLESDAVSVAERLGKFTAMLILKNVKTIVTIVEDIANAVL